MPLYEYQCEACAHRFEQIRRFSDPPLEACPRCGGAVRKLLSSPAIQFKGTGWYVTDYAQQGRKDPSDAADPAESKAAAPADGAASKPDGKDGGKSGDSTGSSDSASAASDSASAEAAGSSKAAGPASAGASS